MPCVAWNEEDWEALLFTLQEKDCILMLGPDSSGEFENGRFISLKTKLAKQLVQNKEIQKDADAWGIDSSNLAQVAQCYVIGKRRQDLLNGVKKFYEAKQELTSDLHMDLATLPIPLILTTTPDSMMCEALKRNNKKPIMASYNHKGGTKENVVDHEWSELSPLVFYICGSIKNTYSLVLAENDILDFLVHVVSKEPPLPNNILTELQHPKKSILFLGFGFRNWYLRILLHALRISSKDTRSFALEQLDAGLPHEFEDTIFFFSRGDYRIQICQMELHNFVSELKKRWLKTTPNIITDDVIRIDSNESARVFICHANEDKGYADGLHKKLKERGLSPWLDSENIRGGDYWNDKIMDVIEKQIDYFLVLQSKHLKQKAEKEAYVNKEINLALDRSKRFLASRQKKFILPLQIDDEGRLSEFDSVQSIDMRKGEGLNDLVKEIKRDIERSKR